VITMPLPVHVRPQPSRTHFERIRNAILTAPIGLLPEQFGRQGSTHAAMPEVQLMLAMLEQALCDLELGQRCDRRRIDGVGAFWDAVGWLAADEPDVPFSFAWICGVLELDPDRVRRRVLRWDRPVPKPRREIGRPGRERVRLAVRQGRGA
jgi:hypothetical protein